MCDLLKCFMYYKIEFFKMIISCYIIISFLYRFLIVSCFDCVFADPPYTIV